MTRRRTNAAFAESLAVEKSCERGLGLFVQSHCDRLASQLSLRVATYDTPVCHRWDGVVLISVLVP